MEDTIGMGTPAPVSSSYCLPHETQLTAKHKVFSVPCGRFTIKDGQDTLLFDVKCKNPFNWRKKRVLYDESGRPVLLLKSMFPSLHKKWAAYRGDEETEAKLLFTLERSAHFQFTPSFDVFLPTNVDSSKPDFTVEGNFLHTVFTVLHNGTPIAKAEKILFTTKHLLTVYPGVDQAFISALYIIVYSQCE